MLDAQVAEYRVRAGAGGLDTFRVAIKESDLQISCRADLSEEAHAALAYHRHQLEDYIETCPRFLVSLAPVPIHEKAPEVVRNMASAAWLAGVGPMAAVAGALAELVGRRLLQRSPEVMVENGGDIFCRVAEPRIVAIDAGPSPLSYVLGIKVRPERGPIGICTSSGTSGRSLSFGQADAACVVASTAALADAAATAIGNVVENEASIEDGLQIARSIPGIRGAVIIVGEHVGAWGDIELAEIGA